MTARDPFSDDGPEIVPPAELLRLRARLSRPPAPAVRAQHLAAVATAARQTGVAGHVGRFAGRGARAALAIVASLAITSGLAAAQVLPQPAQRLLSNVSDRFAPEPDAPPARADEPDRDGGSPTTDSLAVLPTTGRTAATAEVTPRRRSAPVTPTTTATGGGGTDHHDPRPRGPGQPHRPDGSRSHRPDDHDDGRSGIDHDHHRPGVDHDDLHDDARRLDHDDHGGHVPVRGGSG